MDDKIDGISFRLNPIKLSPEDSQKHAEDLFYEISYVLDSKHDRVVLAVLARIIPCIVKNFDDPEELLTHLVNNMFRDLKSDE